MQKVHGHFDDHCDSSGTTTHVRDARGLITQTTDGRGIFTDMTYDAAGRLLTKTYPALPAENVAYTYDTFVAGVNFGRGRTTRIQSEASDIVRQYDARGNVSTPPARTALAG